MKSSVFNTPIINSLCRWLALAGLKLSGWKVIPPAELKTPCVVIGAPHTSNWDFLLMLAGIFVTGIDAKWMGKHTLFKPLVRVMLRWLGGIPVNRSKSHNVVKQMVEYFQTDSSLCLMLAPEGTRKKVSTWKSGFYHIAYRAGVPIMLTVVDATAREIKFAGYFTPTGDYEADLPLILEHYLDARGIVPEKGL